MAVEAHRGLETYQEGTLYRPEWRGVFPAEFSRIMSHTQIDVGHGTFKGLEKLGLRVEIDEASLELLRILPTTANFPQLVFRIYDGEIKLLSGNPDRAERDWVKAIWVNLDEREEFLGLRLADRKDSQQNLNLFRLKRTYQYEVNGDAGHVNLYSWPELWLDDSVR